MKYLERTASLATFIVIQLACTPAAPQAVDAGVDAGSLPSDESTCTNYVPPAESTSCDDRPRTPLGITVAEGCTLGELNRFEGTLASVEPLDPSDGVRFGFDVGTKRCTVDVTGVGSGIALELPHGLPVLGSVVVAPDVPNSYVAVSSQAGRQCVGESDVRYPVLFLAVDGLARNVPVTGPALAIDLDLGHDRCAPTGCKTPRGTTGCTYCQTPDQGCWSYRAGLAVYSGAGCAGLVPTAVTLDETKTLGGDAELRAKLLWGLFQRECDRVWLPEVGRGAFVVWRATR